MNKIITNTPIALVCDVSIPGTNRDTSGVRSEWANEVCALLRTKFHVLTISSLKELETAKRLQLSVVIGRGVDLKWIVKYSDALDCPFIMIGAGDMTHVPFGLNNQFPALVFTTGDVYARSLILRGMFDVLCDRSHGFLYYHKNSSFVDVPPCLMDLAECIIKVAKGEMSLEKMIDVIKEQEDIEVHPWENDNKDRETRCIHIPTKTESSESSSDD